MEKANRDKKEAMKLLREQRKAYIEKARAKIKEQNKVIKSIKEQLKDGGKTVPQLSTAINLPTDKVMWYVASLRKYGVLQEGEKDGDYFKYILAET